MTTTELFRSMDICSANKISEGIKKTGSHFREPVFPYEEDYFQLTIRIYI